MVEILDPLIKVSLIVSKNSSCTTQPKIPNTSALKKRSINNQATHANDYLATAYKISNSSVRLNIYKKKKKENHLSGANIEKSSVSRSICRGRRAFCCRWPHLFTRRIKIKQPPFPLYSSQSTGGESRTPRVISYALAGTLLFCPLYCACRSGFVFPLPNWKWRETSIGYSYSFVLDLKN